MFWMILYIHYQVDNVEETHTTHKNCERQTKTTTTTTASAAQKQKKRNREMRKKLSIIFVYECEQWTVCNIYTTDSIWKATTTNVDELKRKEETMTTTTANIWSMNNTTHSHNGISGSSNRTRADTDTYKRLNRIADSVCYTVVHSVCTLERMKTNEKYCTEMWMYDFFSFF